MTNPIDASYSPTSVFTNSPLGQRPKLQLKPRSIPPPSSPGGDMSPRAVRSQRSRSISAMGDPFGSAVPREQVLLNRGIDPTQMDIRFERKAERTSYSLEQERALDAVQTELDQIETQLREANEMELPEETYRAAAEVKRRELRDLMKQFSSVQIGHNQNDSNSGSHHHHNRNNHKDSVVVETKQETAPTSRLGSARFGGSTSTSPRTSSRNSKGPRPRDVDATSATWTTTDAANRADGNVGKEDRDSSPPPSGGNHHHHDGSSNSDHDPSGNVFASFSSNRRRRVAQSSGGNTAHRDEGSVNGRGY